MPNNLTLQIAVAGGAAAKTAFNDVARAIGDAAKKTQTASAEAAGASDIFKNALRGLGLETEAVERAVGPAIVAINRFSGSFEGLRGAIAAISPELREFADVGIGAGIFLLAKHSADATIALQNQADALGVTTEALETYRLAASSTGGSVEGLDRFLTRFAASLGKAKDAVEQLHEKQSILDQELQVQQTRNRASLDAAAESVTRSYDAIDRQTTSLSSATLAATKASEAFAHLGRQHLTLAETAIPLGTAANDKQREAIEKWRNAQTSATIAAERQKEAQSSLAQAYRQSSLAIEQQRLKSQEAELAQDKLIRQQYDQERAASGPFGKLGLDPTKFKSTEDALAAFVEKLNELNDASAKADILRQVAGRGWVENQGFIKITAEQLEKYRQEVVSVNEDEKRYATDFRAAWSRLTQTVEGAGLIIGDQLTRVFVPLFNGISDLIKNNEENIRAFASAFADIVTPAVKVFVVTISALFTEVIGPVFQLLKSSFADVAQQINAVLGTNVTGSQLVVGMLLLRRILPIVTSLLAPMITVIRNVAGAFQILTGAAAATGGALSLPVIFGAAIPALIALGAYLLLSGDGWKNFRTGVEVTWELLKSVAGWLVTQLINAVDYAGRGFMAVWKGVSDFISGIVDGIIKFFEKLIKKAEDVASAVGAAFGAAGSGAGGSEAANSSTAGAPAGFASGGVVRGPGGTDRVPIMATAGEGVITTRAMGHYGPGLLGAINNLALGARYALGGVVTSLTSGMMHSPLAFADGGVVPALAGGGRSTVNLHIGGETFTMEADGETAGRLARYGRGKQIRQAGTKPSWSTGSGS